jgi:hypothetical protein
MYRALIDWAPDAVSEDEVFSEAISSAVRSAYPQAIEALSSVSSISLVASMMDPTGSRCSPP